MTVDYCVAVSDDVAERLDRLDSEQVEVALMETLKELAQKDAEVSREQDELRERMNLPPRQQGSDSAELGLSAEQKRQQLREFLRGNRKNGIGK
ncbi:hypothetical protein [Haladaptatus sp. DJG-WS-42]|uniref:hypothetical protein n=1 Tax=Haladaptatus sp. DJG-WS-42 TaxID=3120516 RepID=UPI0030D0E5AA